MKELLKEDIKMLLERKGCELKELNIQLDQIHRIVIVPPKLSISNLMGILKDKTAIKIFKSYNRKSIPAITKSTLPGIRGCASEWFESLRFRSQNIGGREIGKPWNKFRVTEQ